MERSRTLFVAAILVAGLVLACGGAAAPTVSASLEEPESVASTSPPPPAPAGPVPAERPGVGTELEEAPVVLVHGGAVDLSLSPWTACWSSGCYDGMPPEVLPDIGSPAEITVEFPVAGWDFSATVRPLGVECGRRQTEPLTRVGETFHRLVPIGLAGEYEVTMFGQGPGGDVFVSFRWLTEIDGVMPVPAASATVLANHDGIIDSYGVELPVWNLRETPDAASASISVTSAEGVSHLIEVSLQDIDCSEGFLYFSAPVAEGLSAADTGSAPFTYEVLLDLDGRTYVGHGVWPDDESPECSPCVDLTFEPALPALSSD